MKKRRIVKEYSMEQGAAALAVANAERRIAEIEALGDPLFLTHMMERLAPDLYEAMAEVERLKCHAVLPAARHYVAKEKNRTRILNQTGLGELMSHVRELSEKKYKVPTYEFIPTFASEYMEDDWFLFVATLPPNPEQLLDALHLLLTSAFFSVLKDKNIKIG